jgi:hypothetical protein
MWIEEYRHDFVADKLAMSAFHPFQTLAAPDKRVANVQSLQHGCIAR